MTAASLAISWGAWHLAEPVALVAAVLAVLPWIAARRRPRLAWPSLEGFRDAPAARAGWIRHLPTLLQGLAIVCLAIALARPRAIGGQERIAARGVAIVAAIDRSSSMTTEDFPDSEGGRSRLDAAKKTLTRFIDARPDDLLGVIAFANIPRRIAPPTLDHAFVRDAVRAIRPARPGEGGTNLGHAIVAGLGDLRDVTTPRKVLVLLTDGRDEPAVSETVRPISPETAAALARELGITLHTIAIGGAGVLAGVNPNRAPMDEPGPDVDRLRELARLGGGQAFSASDAASLDAVFAAIDTLEKSPMVGTVKTRYREGYPLFVAVALACLALDRLVRSGPLRILP